MKQTIVALIKPREDKHHRDISDNEFLYDAKANGEVYNLNDFQDLWNNDEIRVKSWFIRFLVVDSDVKLI